MAVLAQDQLPWTNDDGSICIWQGGRVWLMKTLLCIFNQIRNSHVVCVRACVCVSSCACACSSIIPLSLCCEGQIPQSLMLSSWTKLFWTTRYPSMLTASCWLSENPSLLKVKHTLLYLNLLNNSFLIQVTRGAHTKQCGFKELSAC